MDLIRDRDGDLVGAWEVSRYSTRPAERRSRRDWTRSTDRFCSFIEAEIAALDIPVECEPVITCMSKEDVALETYTRRFDLTPAGVEQLREFLIDNLKTSEALTDAMLWSWAEDVIESLNADNNARIEIRAGNSISGNPLTFELSDDGWVGYFEKD